MREEQWQSKIKKKAAPNANQNYADFTKAYCIDIAIAAAAAAVVSTAAAAAQE